MTSNRSVNECWSELFQRFKDTRLEVSISLCDYESWRLSTSNRLLYNLLSWQPEVSLNHDTKEDVQTAKHLFILLNSRFVCCSLSSSQSTKCICVKNWWFYSLFLGCMSFLYTLEICWETRAPSFLGSAWLPGSYLVYTPITSALLGYPALGYLAVQITTSPNTNLALMGLLLSSLKPRVTVVSHILILCNTPL